MSNNRSYWRVRALPERFFVSGRTWGTLRLLVVIIITIFFVRWSRFIYTDVISVPPSFFSALGLRFWVMPLAALIGALLLGGHYVRDVYELPRLRMSIRYLLAAAFALVHPHLSIRNGKKAVKEGELNLLETIGGPGYVNVGPGSIVLLERLTAPSNVYGAGVHYITRQERIKQIATLEDQHGNIEAVAATTKDGIGIIIRDIQYRYRLRTGRQLGDYTERKPEAPFPFSVQAMRNLTYQPTVTVDGITPWHDLVRINITGAISDYIYKHDIDFLTTPREQEELDPRAEIHKQLFSASTRERLRRVGAELLWVDIGHFDVAVEAVDEQRISTWQSSWIGKATVERAYGEAQRQAYEELGRAEAQAEILMNILHSMNQAMLSKEPSDEIRRLILERTAKLLESIAMQDDSMDSFFPLPPSQPPEQ